MSFKDVFVVRNISRQQWNDAVKAGKAKLQCDIRKYYQGVVVVSEEKTDVKNND